MDIRKALRALLVTLSIAVGLAVAVHPTNAFAQGKDDAAAKALQKKAMEEDYLTTDFASAQKKLDEAITKCGEKCAPKLRAELRRDLGVVLIGGQIDKAKGIQAFVDAIKIDPTIALDNDLKTKELEAAFAEAKKKAGSAPATPPPGPTPPGPGPAPTGDQPQGDFTHSPVAEQQIRTPIPIYVEYAGEESLVKVIARYKGFGMTEWKTVELSKKGEKGWGGLVPCADVQQGQTLYYLQGFNSANDPVATGGDRNHPYRVAVKREALAGDKPHLPGEPPPSQCQDTGDCPPNFPGCKKGDNNEVVTPNKTEPTGKDGGEFCEEDSECKSNECKSSKCTDYKSESTYPKFWMGVWASVDFNFLPSADDVCKLKSTKENQEPVNDANYYCINSDGNDYPYRLTGPGDTSPRGGENGALQAGTSDKVSGGGAFGNVRLMLSLDYAVNTNILVGLRAGYVLNTYPGQAAVDDGKSFPPIHAELRGTFLIGKDAIMQKIAPYVMGGAGVSTFDASVPVSVVELNAGKKEAKTVDAWHLGGPAFFTVGGGVRVGFNPRMAFMGGLRLNLAFGNSFAPSVGPEVGLVFGF